MPATKALLCKVANVIWTWEPPNTGVFYYHCGADGLTGICKHSNGTYCGNVVYLPNEKPAKEFYVVLVRYIVTMSRKSLLQHTAQAIKESQVVLTFCIFFFFR